MPLDPVKQNVSRPVCGRVTATFWVAPQWRGRPGTVRSFRPADEGKAGAAAAKNDLTVFGWGWDGGSLNLLSIPGPGEKSSGVRSFKNRTRWQERMAGLA